MRLFQRNLSHPTRRGTQKQTHYTHRPCLHERTNFQRIPNPAIRLRDLILCFSVSVWGALGGVDEGGFFCHGGNGVAVDVACGRGDSFVL